MLDPEILDPSPLALVCFDASQAHAEGSVRYADDGTVTLSVGVSGSSVSEVRIPPSRQYPLVRATFDDLNKALSRLSNSPGLPGGETLREQYDREAKWYERAAAQAYDEGKWEPDYGTYAWDRRAGDLYLVAPEKWHRLGLVTSNAMLLTDPKGESSWSQVRAQLSGAVVGFAGLSVGSNLVEGWLREGRPRRIKLADPDWLELSNFNRCERASMRHLVGSRAERFDPRSPYDTPRVSKVQYVAYEQRLVDPYLRLDLYEDGITRKNIDRFLLGDEAAGEPPLDVLVEETDDLGIKLLLRERCRELGIDVLMLSDFGHRANVLWNFYSTDRSAPLGYAADDASLRRTHEDLLAGDRSALSRFIAGMCGEGACDAQFLAWLEGRGEQPTGSLPQAGATAMAAGAIGGKELALHILGHNLGRQAKTRAIYDLVERRSWG